MFGEGNQTYQQVVELVDAWRPSQNYGHESKFQKELSEFLDEELNRQTGGIMGGNGDNHVVSRERGNSRGDVVIDDLVGIEMKRHFSNSQKKKLRGQLEDYADNYPYVIALACGIDDMDGWRELENKFSGGRGMGIDQTQFSFIIKRRENFGDDHDLGSGGGFGGIPGI
ncbi:hypothetical protein [Halorientalis halophila]|uniref:hypothetical protein n=1 Tax=Halorientalis halophila TaxID=3108499 RepID=UPI00300A1413